ncbi:MAG TPA: hypothetical protein VH370_00595 [Humisphaera sp.]|jgi:hypothetical protein|nr:hypothetical protein [Humisphaera sp.]
MLKKQSRYSSVPARFEQLESRQLMSAVVPSLTGAPFTGAATSTGNDNSDIVLTIASETKSGHVVGTLVVHDHGGGEIDFIVKGSVNHKGKFNLTCTAAGHAVAKLTGTDANDTLTGKYVAHQPHKHADTGTFVMSR